MRPIASATRDALRRVLPIAHIVHDRMFVRTLLSIEDLAQEFVQRLTAHTTRPELVEALETSVLVAQDDRSSCYIGELVAACRAPGGVDIALAFRPALDPRASMLHISAAHPDLAFQDLILLNASRGVAPILSSTAARVLELAEHAAQRMGQTVGPEHVLLGCTLWVLDTPLQPVLDMLNLTSGSLPQPRPTLRRVFPLGRTVDSGEHTLTLLSLEEHTNGVVVRSHFASHGIGARDALRRLSVHVVTDAREHIELQRVQTRGSGDADRCSFDLTWSSQQALPRGFQRVQIRVPWLNVTADAHVEASVAARHV